MVSLSTWKRIQAASGLTFGVFLILHFASHASLILGWDVGQQSLQNARRIYQNPVIEVTLLLAVLTHMVSNSAVFLMRQDVIPKKDGGKAPVAGAAELSRHQFAGYFLVVLLLGHVVSTRISSLMYLDDPSQFDYTIITIMSDLVPFKLYTLKLMFFGMAASWHLIYGTWSAVATLRGRAVAGKPFPFLLKLVAMIANIGVMLSVLSVGGAFYSINRDAKMDVFEKVQVITA